MTEYLGFGKVKRRRRDRLPYIRIGRAGEGWWHCQRRWWNGTYASAQSWSLWWVLRRSVLCRRRRAAIRLGEGCGWTAILGDDVRPTSPPSTRTIGGPA